MVGVWGQVPDGCNDTCVVLTRVGYQGFAMKCDSHQVAGVIALYSINNELPNLIDLGIWSSIISPVCAQHSNLTNVGFTGFNIRPGTQRKKRMDNLDLFILSCAFHHVMQRYNDLTGLGHTVQAYWHSALPGHSIYLFTLQHYMVMKSRSRPELWHHSENVHFVNGNAMETDFNVNTKLSWIYVYLNYQTMLVTSICSFFNAGKLT